jgi:hypothetical protein
LILVGLLRRLGRRMTYVPVATDVSRGPGPDHGRYYLLADRISDALGQGQGLVVVVGEPLPDSSFLRAALGTTEQRAHVLEVSCATTLTCAEIIKNLARFALVEKEESGPTLAAVRTVIICDDADQLDHDQLETLFRLAHGGLRTLAAVLLASPDFLFRLNKPELQRINSAPLACFSFEELQPGGLHAEEVTGENAERRGEGALNTFTMKLEKPWKAARTNINTESATDSGIHKNASFPAASQPRSIAASAGPRMKMIRRRLGLAMLFCVACVLGDFAVVYTGWKLGPSKGDPEQAIQRDDVVPALPSLEQAPRSDLRATALPIAGGAPNAPSPVEVAPSTSSSGPNEEVAPPKSAAAVAETPVAPSQQAANDRAQGGAGVGNVAAGDKPDAAHPVAANSGSSIAPSAVAPVATDKSARATTTLSASAVDSLFRRGEGLLAAGDIASARLFFERAANAGDPRAAARMAQTFDAGFLNSAGVRGVQGDESRAEFWYRRARQLAGGQSSSAVPSAALKKDNGVD